eukprot:6378409-Prymnesium_polylepis.1
MEGVRPFEHELDRIRSHLAGDERPAGLRLHGVHAELEVVVVVDQHAAGRHEDGEKRAKTEPPREGAA